MEGFTTKKQQFATVWKMHTAGDVQWYPAQVPGTVYTDLLRNGQMEDPFWKDNEDKALSLMEYDYEYVTQFDCPDKILIVVSSERSSLSGVKIFRVISLCWFALYGLLSIT